MQIQNSLSGAVHLFPCSLGDTSVPPGKFRRRRASGSIRTPPDPHISSHLLLPSPTKTMLGCPNEYLAYLAYIPVPIALSYPILVKILRNRRSQKLQKSLGYDDNTTAAEIYERISLSDAQAVMLNLSLLEFPKFFEVALQFALFRVCSTPSRAEFPMSTNSYRRTPFPLSLPSSPKLVSWQTRKTLRNATSTPPSSSLNSLAGRWTQSAPLLQSPVSPQSPLFLAAISNTPIPGMNYLHSQHPSIRPIDTLYTLLLFATQPIVFIELYEWRKPTVLEKAAMWKFWTEIGIRMNIPADTIPKTWDEMREWSEEFERTDMVPSESNNIVGVQTVELLLYWMPQSPLRTFGKQCVYGILDKRLHTAMGCVFPQPQSNLTVTDIPLQLSETPLGHPPRSQLYPRSPQVYAPPPRPAAHLALRKAPRKTKPSDRPIQRIHSRR